MIANAVTKIDTSRYSLTDLDWQEFIYSHFMYVPKAVAVQMFTVRFAKDWTITTDDGLGWMKRMVVRMRKTFTNLHNPFLFAFNTIDTGEQLSKLMRQWTEELEPVATELEELWINTFLAGDLVYLKPDKQEGMNFTTTGTYRVETHETGLNHMDLNISINDAFWRLLVRCFSMRIKTVEII